MHVTSGCSIDELVRHLASLGRSRVSFVRDSDTKRLVAGHESLQPLADEITEIDDYADHEALFLGVGEKTGTLLTAFIHDTRRGQGQGGVRHWSYDDLGALLRDGLRLARGMTRKSALAGLWWGGGKGVIGRRSEQDPRDPDYRRHVFEEYGDFITSLRGAYVTAEDVGTNASDMAVVYSRTRFATCVPTRVGGSGNPSGHTARGVVCAMEGALEFMDRGTLEGKVVALQGIGNVGAGVIELVLQRGARRVVATDISADARDATLARFGDPRLEVRHVSPEDRSIFSEPCDVFAPSALGGVLNSETIELLDTPLVCGAANNQLLDEERHSAQLRRRDIVHVPDFVCNRMGIVTCANEQYGSIADDPVIMRHYDRAWEGSLHQVTKRILQRAEDQGLTPTVAANRTADELAQIPHPIWGHRSFTLVRMLVRDGWDTATND